MFWKSNSYIFTSDVLTTTVIIYFIGVIDFLGNHIYIFIDYNPLLKILRCEIYQCKLDFETHLKPKLTDCPYPIFYKIELRYCHYVEAMKKTKSF